jgi:hypothetical protein
MIDPEDLQVLVNDAMDVSYDFYTSALRRVVRYMTTNPASIMQKQLHALDVEAKRLDEVGGKFTPDNLILLQTFAVVRGMYETISKIIGQTAPSLENDGRYKGMISVTVKCWPNLMEDRIAGGEDPFSAESMEYYRKELKKKGIVWPIL